ncbi:DUF4254 domain-containing protein [Candidatus Pseudothioglobus singularis]|jgi:hypothetical protein|nr:DUF4254 domain-containing protein [Candidatus Pseudothioglobus singularis]
MEDIFNDIDKNKISEYHDDCHKNSSWPEHSQISHEEHSIWFWIEKNHLYNCKLWDEEDRARRSDVDDSHIALNKRNIDRFNQKRNDAIENIDEKILDRLSNVIVKEGAWFNSETAGSIIDRLSIVSLKILHMGIQADRSDIDKTQKEEAHSKRKRLISQKDDLIFCLNQILRGALKGRTFYRIYRQYKMYNDPKMNPYLSGLIK